MTGAPKTAGRKPVRVRPEVPRADYSDEVSAAAMKKLRAAVAEENDPKRKRVLIANGDLFTGE